MNYRQMMISHLQNQPRSIQRQLQEAQKPTGFSLRETGVYISNPEHHEKSKGDIFLDASEVGVDLSNHRLGREADTAHLKKITDYYNKKHGK